MLLIFNISIAQNLSNQNNLPQEIKVAVASAPPMIILHDNKKPEGFLIDFMNEVARLEKWKIQWVQGSWAHVFEKAKLNEVDLMTYIAYSADRGHYFNFSTEPFITGWGQVYTYDKSIYQNILDFDNKTIAVMEDDIHAIRFIDICKKFKVNCVIKLVQNYDEGFQLLQNKEVEGVVCSNTIGHDYEMKYKVFQTSVMFHPSDALFAVAKSGNNKLLERIDYYLKMWKKDPESPYSLSREKWMHNSNHSIIPLWAKYLIASALILVVVFACMLMFLRKKLKKYIFQFAQQSVQLKQIINLVPHMIYIVNSKGRVVLVNKYAAEFFGVSSSTKTTKQNLLDKVPRYHALFEDDKNLLSKGTESVHKEIGTTNCQYNEVAFNLHKVPFDSIDNLPSVLTVGVDITEEKIYQEKIKYMAEHDDLTGLPNRQMLKNSIQNALSLQNTGNCFGAVLYIDLDYFKTINDSLGHAEGDKLLIVIADRLKQLVSDKDIVARIGGDEFIVELKDVSTDFTECYKETETIARTIIAALAQKISIGIQDLYISASIGIVIYPDHASSFNQVMQRADIAMYQAKNRGRNTFVFFEPQMEEKAVKKHQWISELRNAIDQSEFLIYYQPQISGKEERLSGLEALVRWNHPDGRVIKPLDFICLAEECGLIIPLGNFVIEEVFKHVKRLLCTYSSIPLVTINISVLQIHSDNLVDHLRFWLNKYSIPAHLIELEVTESVMVTNLEKTIYNLSQLKNLGVHLSIDDFGTGYSSLSYLKKLPFDKLKIDYSFIKDITTDTETKTIVKTIIGMARDLELDVIAEGVETLQQRDMLVQLGCTSFQGYFYDEPMPLAEIEAKYFCNTQTPI